MTENSLPIESSQFLLYTAEGGKVHIEVFLQDETVWLTQRRMAELFGIEVNTINYHIKEVFKSGELQEEPTIRKIRIVQKEGKRDVERDIEFYNLDMIISVGYRVNSIQATHFRKWATKTLREFIIKGFALDDDRLKQARTAFGIDYFRELLERIRSIRASERRIYQQITDVFAECSIDYDRESEITKDFYAMVQNKFHFAITGHTAAEIIHIKAKASEPHMGLQTWKHSPDGRILKSDTAIAKNYLEEKEIKRLERTVSGFFDYVEGLIERENIFTMEQFAMGVDKFLTFNEYKVLHGKGKISKSQADKKASNEYEKFNKIQKIESDFDKMVSKLKAKKDKNE
ncbi:MAG: virulence RhuM family protein [Bacteroidales bacterium]|nr:virulence RhuM family protein [Bacteroidales bacterium]